ncbi:restriction endonuclease subunit S [Alteromonas macleodii]|uniref:restriction endonuclease subunit S n=1 Tax=Alteromonas macleodii TaxID=28108 RepID=UPI00068BF3A7|nr:restriction endonuclease subunit S [Alteromonas macleodii]
MSELPKGWKIIRLRDEATSIKGKKPKILELDLADGLVPYIDIKAFEKGILTKYASPDAGVNANEIDTLMVWDGARSGLVGNGVNGVIGSTLVKIKPKFSHHSYLHYFLRSKYSYINSNTKGTGIPHVDPAKLWELDYPLAPINEQIRIVNKLDSILDRVNKAQVRLDKIPAILKRFRQSVLAAATSGELTKDWREIQTRLKVVSFDDLLKKKTDLIKDKLVKKDLELRDLTELDIPDSWIVVNLGGLASKVTDGEHKTPKRKSEGRFLLSARNVRDGSIKLEKVDYVGEDEFKKLRKRCDPNKGDILISCSGSVGRIALCDKDDEYVMVRSAALVKTDLMGQNNKYLMYVLQSPVLQQIIINKSKSTAQSNLFLAPIKELPIPLPSKEEQKEIVRRVESLFTIADKFEKQHLDAKARTNRLTQSILSKAFRGELVSQEKNDEPAEKLLSRIQSELEKKPKDIVKNTAKKSVVKNMKIEDAPKNYLKSLMPSDESEIQAKELWKDSKMTIDDFYAQLKKELINIEEINNSLDPNARTLKALKE